MSVDIAEFLAAQLDAEEAAARATSSLRWRTDDPFGSDIIIPAEEPSYEANRKAIADCMEANGYRPGSLPDAAHIAYWDPARVLADIAAKRAILDRVVPAIRTDERMVEGEWGSGIPDLASHENSGLLLRLLAAPYADRPGYDDAWRIDG